MREQGRDWDSNATMIVRRRLLWLDGRWKETEQWEEITEGDMAVSGDRVLVEGDKERSGWGREMEEWIETERE